ncbi:hypothetical protein KTT_56630 [Tengunoibacter tsumagoiensis]|uniref:Uncharacterized protein n=1 Tax=Tengunoibacter tsumagoiensis TaxID=2014871 RepID=A0A402A9E4_9CHLR|nr:hypothetical protein KTT_56630 [Tengunoibacter tsumagoiensis]
MPIFLSPDPRVSEYQASKMGHVEDQTVKWAIDEIKIYNEAHPDRPIKSVTLNIYTFKEPCSDRYADCNANLRRPKSKDGSITKSPWEKKIDKETGGKTDSTIVVWSSYGNSRGSDVKPWPKE